MSDLTVDETQEVIVRAGSTSSNELEVNSDGSLNVNIISAPSTPPSANTISQFVAQNKVYSFSSDLNMTTSGTQNPLVLLKNPSGSGKVIYLYKVIFGTNVTNVLAEFKIYANPTVTANGTAITPISNNIGGGASASIVQAYSLSTVSSPGSNLNSFTISQNNSAFSSIEDFSIFIQPDNSLLLTGNPGSNSREASITVVWVEV